jgi:large repetitive protein
MAVYTLRVIKSGRTVLRKQVSDGLGRDAVVIPAQADVTYLLSDPLSNAGPEKISAKRVGKNLHISLGKGNPDTPDVVIEGYFDFPTAPISGTLADGGQAVYDLGALTQANPASTPASSTTQNAVAQASLPGDGSDKFKLMLGGLGLLALAGAGGGGGGGGLCRRQHQKRA